MTVFSEVTAVVSSDVIKTVPLFAKLISDLGGEYGLDWYYELSNGDPSGTSVQTVPDDVGACLLHGTWNNIKEFHDVLDTKYRQSQALRKIQDLAFSKQALIADDSDRNEKVGSSNGNVEEKNENKAEEEVPEEGMQSQNCEGVPGWVPRFRRAKKNKSYAEPKPEVYEEDDFVEPQRKQKAKETSFIYNEEEMDEALDDDDDDNDEDIVEPGEDEEDNFTRPPTQKQTKVNQKCKFCEFETKIITTWCNHMIENHLPKKWLCPLCDKSTMDKGELKKHLQRHCMQQQPFKCNKCRKVYVSPHSLKIHKCKPKVKRYPCKVCGKAYVKKEYLRWHSCGQRTRRCWKYYTCAYCQAKFVDQNAYEEHEAECEADSKGVSHAEKPALDDTGELNETLDKTESNDSNDGVIVAKSASDWRAHYKIVEGMIVCIHCSFKSEYRRHMRTHLMRKHFAKSLQCTECDHKFAIPRDLKFHMESRHYNVKYMCELCGKQYRSKTALVIHERRHKEGPRQIPCDLCGKNFSSHQYVNVHKEKVHGGKIEEYFCEQCGKKFANKYYLRDHQKTHGDQMPYECSECFKAFAHKRSYECHLQSHTAERNKVCHVCGKGFKATSHLNMHLRIHYGQKPFVCSYCGRGFTQKKTMMEHARTHTGEKPVKCKVCNKTFAHGSTLHKHMRVHTKQVIDGGMNNIEQASKQLAEESLQQVQDSISQLADTALKQHQLHQQQQQQQVQHQSQHLPQDPHEQDHTPVQASVPGTPSAIYSSHPIYHYPTLQGIQQQPTPTVGDKQQRTHPEHPHITHTQAVHSTHMIPAHNMYGPGPLGSAYALDAQSFQEVHQLMHPPQQ